MNSILIAFVSVLQLQFSIAANTTGIGWGDTIIIKQQGIYKFITTYTDGKKNGKEYVLNSAGDTIIASDYRNDVPDGQFVLYYKGGKIGAIDYYEAGYKTGISRRFDTMGHIVSERTFDGKYRWTDLIWSGKITHYADNQRICTDIYTNGKKTSVIVYDKKRYRKFKKTEAKRIKISREAIRNGIIGP